MTRQEVLKSMIAEYQRKVETYQTMIAEWHRELGVATLDSPSGSAGDSDSSTATAKKARSGDPLTIVTAWQFFNKSQPEAAKLLLEAVGHPLETEQIVEGLEKGGVEIGGSTAKDKKQNLYTILGRSGQFGRAAKNTWGLLTWPNVKPVSTKKGSKENGADKEAEKESEAESAVKEEAATA
jgi:hypothetical protein